LSGGSLSTCGQIKESQSSDFKLQVSDFHAFILHSEI
jgi:hypothetical protein